MIREFDIVIVGAGMVGLAFAAGLKECDVSVMVADASAAGAGFNDLPSDDPGFINSGWSPRVSAINSASKRFLTKVGAWERMNSDRIGLFDQIRVWDGEGNAQIEFQPPEHANLGYVIENNHLQAALESVLTESAHIELERGVRLTDLKPATSRYELEFAEVAPVSAGLVVGADGARSTVRELAGIQSTAWDHQQNALVSTVMLERPHQRIAWQCFSAAGPLAFLPLADERLCSIVWSVSSDFCHRLAQMDCVALCQELTRASEGRLGEILRIDHRYSFPLEQRHTRRYRKSNLVVIGDAAHSIHPLAGQGVNLGLQDARMLSTEILNGIDNGGISDLPRVLSRYEKRRMVASLSMMAAMEGFRWLYDQQDPAVTWIRNTGMTFVNRSVTLKKLIMRYASGDFF